MTCRIPVVVALITVVGTTTAIADDWLEFRGPGGQGHSAATNLPTEWSTTKNVRWKVPIAGHGWSSPIVLDGRVFLTSSVSRGTGNPQDQTLKAICLDAKTGKSLWEKSVFEQNAGPTSRIHGKNTHASPTPISDGRYLFVHFGTHGTACLTLDGDIVWKTRELVYKPQHGNGGSPVLVDDLLVIACDGADVDFVVALDRKSGKIRWKTDRPAVTNPRKFSFSTPLVIKVKGKSQIICPGTDLVIAYDPKTGNEIWKLNYDGYSVVPRPVFGHGLVFICTGWSSPKLLAIRPDGTGNVTESHLAWTSLKAVPNTPSPLLIGDELYFISDRGVASCIDAKTGKVHWTKRVGGNYSASPIFADGKIYFQSEQGDTTVIKPGKSYVELSKNSLNARTLASSAVADSALFIRTEGELFRIEKK